MVIVGAVLIPTLYIFLTPGSTVSGPSTVLASSEKVVKEASGAGVKGVGRRVAEWSGQKQWFGSESSQSEYGAEDHFEHAVSTPAEVIMDLEEDLPGTTYDGGESINPQHAGHSLKWDQA